MARILVIEDNPDSLELTRYLLQSLGHEVLTAAQGADGLAVAQAQLPQLIICDIHMPGMDGREVARRLKAGPATRRIPLIALTALAMVGDRERVLAAGFDAYLSKPVEPQDLVAQLDRRLAAEPVGTGDSAVPAPATVSAQPPVAAAPAVTLLAVDNTPANLELVRSLFEPHGFHVHLAHTAEDGLLLARSERPDLILTDLDMPGMDGLALLQALRDDPALARTPVVVMSSSSWGSHVRERALALGATHFIEHPLDPPMLLAEVRACLGEPRT